MSTELNQNQHIYSEMLEPHLNKCHNYSKHGIFSNIQIPPTTPFFTRLDGRRFKAVKENWELPRFSSEKGQTLIQEILERSKLMKGR